MPEENAGLKPRIIEIDADWPFSPPGATSRRLVVAAVVGESPAVVTETLWWLFNQRPTEHPERVVIFTTTAGRQQICGKYDELPYEHRNRPLKALPERTHKPWEGDDLILALCRLCREWQRAVPVVEIHVPRGASEREIEDIRTEADDRAFGNRVFREIRKLTADRQPAVHASIAGGRKTMGTRLAGVLSMFGRPEDELSHVLVTNPDYEGPGYWCPSKHAGEVRVEHRGRSSKRVEVSDESVVQLVRQRFWPLRNLIDERVLKSEKEIDLDELELAVEAMLNPPPISLTHQPARHRIECRLDVGVPGKGSFYRSIPLQPKEYALYCVLAQAKQESVIKPRPGDDEEHDETPEIEPGYIDGAQFGPISYSSALIDDCNPEHFCLAGKRYLEILQTVRANEDDYQSGKTRLYQTAAPELDSEAVKERAQRQGRPIEIASPDPRRVRNSVMSYFSSEINKLNEKIYEQLGFRKLADRYEVKTHSRSRGYGPPWRVGIDL